MQDDLTRAQHYRSLASHMRDTAERENNQARRNELLDLSSQYDRLADKLVDKHTSRNNPVAGDLRQPK